MKIAIISTADDGGAGKDALRLHLGLKSIGLGSKMLVLRCNSSNSDLVKFGQNDSIFKKIQNKVHNKLVSSEFNLYKNTRPKELDLFSDDRTPYTVSKHPLVQEADIINLGWIATLIDYRDFFSHLNNKPIVWRLSDMNPFTGGCHYTGDCTKYETGCGACPQLGSKDSNDLSRRIFKRKETAYKKKNIYIVTPSKWLGDCAKRSLLFRNFKIEIIPAGVPTFVFTPHDKKPSRNLLYLPQDKTLILFGVSYKTERKGFSYLMQALRLLQKKVDTSKIALVTFGPPYTTETFSENAAFSIYPLGYIHSEPLLSSVYSAADMLIIPSLEDNLPNIMLESMACGTPVVGFGIGGVVDTIKPGQTGLLVKAGDAEELAEKIAGMINHPEECREMGEKARKLVDREYTLRLQAERYLKLYKAILKSA